MAGRLSRVAFPAALILLLSLFHASGADRPPARGGDGEAVQVELRFFAVGPNLAQQFGVGRTPVRFGKDRVRKLLEAIQGDIRASQLRFMKVTASAGLVTALHAEESQGGRHGGVEISLRPSLCPGRRSVRLGLKAKVYAWAETFGPPAVERPVSADVNFTTPDGATVGFEVGRRVRLFHETQRVPLLAELPLLGPLFTDEVTRDEEERILVLVTPCVVRRP